MKTLLLLKKKCFSSLKYVLWKTSLIFGFLLSIETVLYSLACANFICHMSKELTPIFHPSFLGLCWPWWACPLMSPPLLACMGTCATGKPWEQRLWEDTSRGGAKTTAEVVLNKHLPSQWADIRRKRSYNPTACGKETMNTISQTKWG